jgi:hypothetical protein
MHAALQLARASQSGLRPDTCVTRVRTNSHATVHVHARHAPTLLLLRPELPTNNHPNQQPPQVLMKEQFVKLAELDVAYWTYWLSTSGYASQVRTARAVQECCMTARGRCCAAQCGAVCYRRRGAQWGGAGGVVQQLKGGSCWRCGGQQSGWTGSGRGRQ